jgi:hypothetical protein
VYTVDDDGQVYSQVGSTAGNQSSFPYFCTQESQNLNKGKGVSVANSEDEAHNEAGYEDFDMGEAEFSVMEEFRRKEEIEVAELIEQMRKQREDPRLHCEGDTDIEDLFVGDEEAAPGAEAAPEATHAAGPEAAAAGAAQEDASAAAGGKKRKLSVRRKGPTLRSHSSLVIDDGPNWKPDSDEDKCPDFLEFSDDDGYQPLVMLPPKGRKSRAKKRAERNWYDERRLQAHEQLCLHMCFRDVNQFREALINLHIAQNRNYNYHRNSNVRVIVDCLQENCPFYMVASEIKNEKTFVIRKMQLEHTCETTNESTRVSAKWLARSYCICCCTKGGLCQLVLVFNSIKVCTRRT